MSCSIPTSITSPFNFLLLPHSRNDPCYCFFFLNISTARILDNFQLWGMSSCLQMRGFVWLCWSAKPLSTPAQLFPTTIVSLLSDVHPLLPVLLGFHLFMHVCSELKGGFLQQPECMSVIANKPSYPASFKMYLAHRLTQDNF